MERQQVRMTLLKSKNTKTAIPTTVDTAKSAISDKGSPWLVLRTSRR